MQWDRNSLIEHQLPQVKFLHQSNKADHKTDKWYKSKQISII